MLALPLLETVLIGLGGVTGYLLRGVVDERFAHRRERRVERREDLKKQRELLLEFLGGRRAHFDWLLAVRAEGLAGGDPPAHEKVRMIAEWVYENRPRFPRKVQGELNLIMQTVYALLTPGSAAYQWAKSPNGFEALRAVWRTLEEYEAELRTELTGNI